MEELVRLAGVEGDALLGVVLEEALVERHTCLVYSVPRFQLNESFSINIGGV